jgi:hypothetical protein
MILVSKQPEKICFKRRLKPHASASYRCSQGSLKTHLIQEHEMVGYLLTSRMIQIPPV